MKKPCQLHNSSLNCPLTREGRVGWAGDDMFRHEDIIIVVSYYEKLGRGYRPSLFSFVCVFGGWLGVGGGNLFFSGFLFPSFVGAMITSHYGFTIFLVRIDQTLSLKQYLFFMKICHKHKL